MIVVRVAINGEDAIEEKRYSRFHVRMLILN